VADRGSRPTERPPPEISLVLPREPSRADVDALCDEVRELAERARRNAVECDVGEVTDPDADTIDAMARLQLAALRLGVRFRFSDACEELRDLLALTGLDDVLPCEAPPCDAPGRPNDRRSGVEPLGQAEDRKEALRVEEKRDARDPTV
jgi:STAS domain